MTSSAPPLLEVEGLTFRYRRATEPAIRDLNLTLASGQVLLVAGPSGCGKSTLIRAINGLIPHAYPGELTGSVRIQGRLTTDLKLRDIALTVGTVLQDPAKQIVGATVEAELAFGPENLGVPRNEIRARIDRVVGRAGIRELVGRETAALSGGERQLVATAGTLMMEPRLYVVDEPLANLDPATAERLLLLLRELADRGDAVVIVEHRVEEALDLRPDRVLYLDDGRERYQGPLDGFLKVADPEAVKLPFDVVLERVRAGARPDGQLPPDLERPADRSQPARLEFRGVRAGYERRDVLRGIDARFERREIVAVLGPNGSGKTTLFRTAMRLMPVTAREVLAIAGLESLYLVTHDVDLALTHADRILLFREGEVVADGPPTDVIRDQPRWIACNLRPTSLLKANIEWGVADGRFLSAEALARRIVAGGRAPARAHEGRS